VELITRHPGACWLAAGACLAAATAVLHPGGLFNIIVSLRTKQPFARTIAGILLTGGLSAFLVAPAVFGEHLGEVLVPAESELLASTDTGRDRIAPVGALRSRGCGWCGPTP